MKIILASNDYSLSLLWKEELEEANHFVYQSHSIEVTKCLMENITPEAAIIAFFLPFEDDFSDVEHLIDEIKKVNNKLPIFLLTADFNITLSENSIARNVEAILPIASSFEELLSKLEKISISKRVDTSEDDQQKICVTIRGKVITYDYYLSNLNRYIRFEKARKKFFIWTNLFIETISNISDNPKHTESEIAIIDIEDLMDILNRSYNDTYYRESKRGQELAHYCKYKCEHIATKYFQYIKDNKPELLKSIQFDINIIRNCLESSYYPSLM